MRERADGRPARLLRRRGILVVLALATTLGLAGGVAFATVPTGDPAEADTQISLAQAGDLAQPQLAAANGRSLATVPRSYKRSVNRRIKALKRKINRVTKKEGPKGDTGAKGDKGDPAQAGPARSASLVGSCDPSAAPFIECLSVLLTLPASGRVMLVADSGWHVLGAPSRGDCRLEVDGAALAGASVSAGEEVDTTSPGSLNFLGVNAVTDILAAGAHTFTLACREESGSISFLESTLSALYVGAS